MVWSEHDRSSTSVETMKTRSIVFLCIISVRCRRIASNEFDRQVNVHVAMDNTIVLDDIRTFYDRSHLIASLSSLQANYAKSIRKFVQQQQQRNNRPIRKRVGNH